MVVGQRSKLILLVREQFLHQTPEAGVKIGAAAAGFADDHASPFNVCSQILAFGGGKVRGFVPVDKEDRRPQQIGNRRVLGIDRLPGQKVLPVS